MVEARLPAKQSNRPDPLLDRLLVELEAGGGKAPSPLVLARIANDATAPDHVHNLLLLATAEESSGDAEKAAQHYGAVAAAIQATADQHVTARLGLSRLKLGSDPAAAAAMLRALDPVTIPAATRWEVDLQLARALAIAEPADRAAQDGQLARAWMEAPEADVGSHAVARVASDWAIHAARDGDRAKLITLLAIDRSNRRANDGNDTVRADLPICGEKGIEANDMVVVEAQRIAPLERPRISLAWASRTGIGGTFLASVRQGGRFAVSDGAVAQILLRCRSAPAPDYAVALTLADLVEAWMTGKGAYPFVDDDQSRDVARLATILADRTSRYGVTSIMRLPVLLQLMSCVFPQIERDEQARARVDDLVRQITVILDANGAPEDMKLLWRMSSVGMSVATRARSAAQAQAEVQALLIAAATNSAVSRDLIYTIAAGLSAQPSASSALKETILTAALKLFDHEPGDDPRARALSLQLSTFRAGNGDVAGAGAAISQAHIPDDLCAVVNPPPRLISINVSSDDYPADLLNTMMFGLDSLDYDLDASGQAVNSRIVMSDPPYAFDDASIQAIATLRFDPPLRDGKPHACRGASRNIRWQIPY